MAMSSENSRSNRDVFVFIAAHGLNIDVYSLEVHLSKPVICTVEDLVYLNGHLLGGKVHSFIWL